MLGDNAPVLLPPACFLRDADISQKLLWEGMTIVQPWDMDDIAPEVYTYSALPSLSLQASNKPHVACYLKA